MKTNIRTDKRILEKLVVPTSSSFVKFLISKPITYFVGIYMAWFFYLETIGVS